MSSAVEWPHPALDPWNHVIPAIQTFGLAVTTSFSSVPYTSYTHLKHAYLLFYKNADPFQSAMAICTIFTIHVYVMEKLTGNASQVDGLWTFLPLIYSFHFTFHGYLSSPIQPAASFFEKVEPRIFLMFVLTLLWSIRLTFNAYRRGMFKRGEEDYRWPLLRANMPRPVWELFSFFFIAIAQNILLGLTALPQYLLLTTTYSKYTTHPPAQPVNRLTMGDYVLATLFVTNLTIQFYADQQQWNYQNYKRGLDSNERPLPVADTQVVSGHVRKPIVNQKSMPFSTTNDAERGFVTRGLWAWSRHPNFACEQTTWWILYAFVPLTFLTNDWSNACWQLFINYAIISPMLMVMLFFPSAVFSESVTASKYPEYVEYQKRVGMFLPIDTLLRNMYYNWIASKSTKQTVEDNVWGKSRISKKKSQ